MKLPFGSHLSTKCGSVYQWIAVIRHSAGILIFIASLLISIHVFADEEDLSGVAIHGFISQGYMKSTDGNEYMTSGTDKGTFQFNEMGINFSKNVSDSLRIGTQLMAYDLGSFGNDEVLIDWAFADYNFNDYLNLMVDIDNAMINIRTIILPLSLSG